MWLQYPAGTREDLAGTDYTAETHILRSCSDPLTHSSAARCAMGSQLPPRARAPPRPDAHPSAPRAAPLQARVRAPHRPRRAARRRAAPCPAAAPP